MRTLFVFLSFLLVTALQAQSVFIVQGDTSVTAHQTFAAALDSAQDGDYIYLPGGTFNIGTVYIDKQVHIIGAGEHPDSSITTSRTHLNGEIRILNNASGSTFEGFWMQSDGEIYFGTDCVSAKAQNILIQRCNVQSIYLTFDKTSSAYACGASNIIIRECVVRYEIYGANNTGILIQNNLIGKLYRFNTGATIENNIFTLDAEVLHYVYNCTFKNNIFATQSGDVWVSGSYGSNTVQGNTFYNDIFSVSWIQNMGTAYNCQFSVPYHPLFVNSPSYGYTYSHNLHLVPGSAAAGTGFGGTDCGIYGGANPAKDGLIPKNPHFQSKTIPLSTNSQGELEINIKVKAQDR